MKKYLGNAFPTLLAVLIINSLTMALDAQISSSILEKLDAALKDETISLQFSVTALNQGNPKGSAISCEAKIKNTLPIAISLSTIEAVPPIKVFIQDKDGKSVGPEYETSKVTTQPRTTKKLTQLDVKAQSYKDYNFVIKDSKGNPLILAPGEYKAYALFPVILDPKKSLTPRILKSDTVNFSIK